MGLQTYYLGRLTLFLYSIKVNSKGTDETEQIRRLAFAFAIHLYGKYQHLNSWNK